MLTSKMQASSFWRLTAEGQTLADTGTPEMVVYNVLKERGECGKEELEQVCGEAFGRGFGQCMKNQWIQRDGNVVKIKKAVEKDEIQESLQEIQVRTHSPPVSHSQ